MADPSIDPQSRRPPTVMVAALCLAILIPMVWKTHQRNEDWRDEAKLWAATIAESPGKIRPRINYAVVMKTRRNYAEALSGFQAAAALALRSGMNDREKNLTRQYVMANVMDILFETRQFAEAEQAAADLWNEFPGFPPAAIMISKFALLRNQPEFALQILDAAIAEDIAQRAIGGGSGMTPWKSVYLNRGSAYQLLGDCGKANKDYARARREEGGVTVPDCIEKETF